MPRLNHPIPLALQLWDRDTSKFIRATVRLPDGAQVPGSPLTLPHAADGFYTSTSILMPKVDFVSVFYEVFADQAQTIPSAEHGEAFEIFELSGVSGGGGTSGFDDLVAIIDDATIPLVATVEEARIFVGGVT